jgi:hypothetical protein
MKDKQSVGVNGEKNKIRSRDFEANIVSTEVFKQMRRRLGVIRHIRYAYYEYPSSYIRSDAEVRLR